MAPAPLRASQPLRAVSCDRPRSLPGVAKLPRPPGFWAISRSRTGSSPRSAPSSPPPAPAKSTPPASTYAHTPPFSSCSCVAPGAVPWRFSAADAARGCPSHRSRPVGSTRTRTTMPRSCGTRWSRRPRTTESRYVKTAPSSRQAPRSPRVPCEMGGTMGAPAPRLRLPLSQAGANAAGSDSGHRRLRRLW